MVIFHTSLDDPTIAMPPLQKSHHLRPTCDCDRRKNSAPFLFSAKKIVWLVVGPPL